MKSAILLDFFPKNVILYAVMKKQGTKSSIFISQTKNQIGVAELRKGVVNSPASFSLHCDPAGGKMKFYRVERQLYQGFAINFQVIGEVEDMKESETKNNIMVKDTTENGLAILTKKVEGKRTHLKDYGGEKILQELDVKWKKHTEGK